MIFEKENITKKEAARIVHEYIRDVLGEKDLDVKPAEYLQDIYDCHTCVQHVTQVYFKGIIFPESDRVFGMQIILGDKELQEIEERVFDKGKRRPPQEKTKKEQPGKDATDKEASYISLEDIKKLNDPLIIDVSMGGDSPEKVVPKAINIPLHKINLNPYIISDDKFRQIVFVCENGTNSKIAAEIAGKNGYCSVFYSKYSSDLK
ncbi:MAG: rhodanese-like domain-containing protein [Butyrivibrio sp.]|nr:rhodanese-like domain-containing protein [Butyrivibrio sp.]